MPKDFNYSKMLEKFRLYVQKNPQKKYQDKIFLYSERKKVYEKPTINHN